MYFLYEIIDWAMISKVTKISSIRSWFKLITVGSAFFRSYSILVVSLLLIIGQARPFLFFSLFFYPYIIFIVFYLIFYKYSSVSFYVKWVKHSLDIISSSVLSALFINKNIPPSSVNCKLCYNLKSSFFNFYDFNSNNFCF